MHLQLPQILNFLSSRTETLPSTFEGPRLAQRKTRRNRSGEVTLRVTTPLGWWERKGREAEHTLNNLHHHLPPAASSSTARPAACSPKQHAKARKPASPNPAVTACSKGMKGAAASGTLKSTVRLHHLPSLAGKADSTVKKI